MRSFETRFPYGSAALQLNLATHSNSPARSTKSTRSLSLPLLVNIGFQVLFHSPPGGAFHLSLTVLYAIGHQVVFSLGGWTPLLPTGLLVSCGTPDSRPITLISLTGLLPSSAALSNALQLCVLLFLQVLYPECP